MKFGDKKILAIDTSFDETSVSVTRGFTVMSNVLPSQTSLHKEFGGVVPSIAKLAHKERMDKVIQKALKNSGHKIEDIDIFVVTRGPGLALTLEVGIAKAKELSDKYKKPLIAINHMEGHLLSCLAERNSAKKINNDASLNFPIIGFLISGGHTELILAKEIGDYVKIGETQDDSCGEAYDKCGRLLGLGYPAGPVISKLCNENRSNYTFEKVNENKSVLIKTINNKSGAEYLLPVPMANSGDLNFSFSGLKTAFNQLVNIEKDRRGSLSKDQIIDLSLAFEASAIEQLVIKLEKAIKLYSPKDVWLGGGVIASGRLRECLRKVCTNNSIKLRFPYSKKLTGDNAAMIGVTAFIKVEKLGKINHSPDQGIFINDFAKLDRDPSLSL